MNANDVSGGRQLAVENEPRAATTTTTTTTTTATTIIDCAAAARYVLSRQTPEGGYSFYRTPEWRVEEPNAPDTLAALESLRLLGIDAPEPRSTLKWLVDLQYEDGGYPTLTIGWAALRALARLESAPARSPMPWLHTWMERAGQLDQRDPDWRGALLGASRIVGLFQLLGEAPSAGEREGVAGLLDVVRDRASGGFVLQGPDLEATAAGLGVAEFLGVGRQLLGGIVDFVCYCEDPVVGLSIAPGARSTSATTLSAGLALFSKLGLKVAYPNVIAHNLALLQRPNGGCSARHRGIPTLEDTWHTLVACNLLALVSS